MKKCRIICIDDLMYKGCKFHYWKCTIGEEYIPFRCYNKEQFESKCCNCHKINCKGFNVNARYNE